MNNKTRLITAILWMASAIMYAGTPWLKKPLRFVEADSVITWGYDGRDFRRTAFTTDSTAQPLPTRLTRSAWNNRKIAYQRWQETFSQRNLVGGVGDAQTESQGIAAARWVEQAQSLFLMQGDAAYIDCVERALFNAVMHTAQDTTDMAGSIDRKIAAAQLLAFPAWMYATKGTTDLYINLYANATSNIRWGDTTFSLDQITDMPVSGSVKFRFNGMGKGLRFKVHLRMPEWTGMRKNTPYVYVGGEAQQPTVYVNGHEVDPLQVDEKGYVVIDRVWRSLEEIYIDFPLHAQYVLPASTSTDHLHAPIHGRAALQWGPLVYLAGSANASQYFMPTQPVNPTDGLSRSGYPVLQGTFYNTQGVPQDAQAPAHRFIVQPYCD